MVRERRFRYSFEQIQQREAPRQGRSWDMQHNRTGLEERARHTHAQAMASAVMPRLAGRPAGSPP